jgi:hypothetical protein
LNHNQSVLPLLASTGAVSMPQQNRIEDRCPLSMVEPMKSNPIYFAIEVPAPTAPPAPQGLRTTSRPGAVQLRWNEDRPGQYRYNVYAGERKLTAEPIVAGAYNVITNVLEDAEYTVETVSKLVGGRSTVIGQPLPERKEPVFDLSATKGNLVSPATFDENELDLSKGGYFAADPNDEWNVKEAFSFECSVKFDEPGVMPIVVSHGMWNSAGWFLQRFNNGWRFHVGGVDCDGGSAKVGEWLHMVGTYDGEVLRLYENGRLVAEKPAVVNPAPWSGNLIIGQYGPLTPDFQVKGRIKDVRIWQRVIPVK